MKATFRIEISDGCSAVTSASVEAPTLDMLKASVIRTTLLQLPDLVRHVFEEAAKPKETKPKELENDRQETKAPAKKPAAKGKKAAAPVLPADIPAGQTNGQAAGEGQQAAPADIPGTV